MGYEDLSWTHGWPFGLIPLFLGILASDPDSWSEKENYKKLKEKKYISICKFLPQ